MAVSELQPAAFAIGMASYAIEGGVQLGQVPPSRAVLEVRYFSTNLETNYQLAGLLAEAVGYTPDRNTYALSEKSIGQTLSKYRPNRNGLNPDLDLDLLESLGKWSPRNLRPRPSGLIIPRQPVVAFIPDLQKPPNGPEDAYLRLTLLSERKVTPNSINVDDIFVHLNNVVWTNEGPFSPDSFRRISTQAAINGTPLQVSSLDKFPRLLDHIVPDGVRIADGARVRLGAYLAPGTTVMQEGFVNYNAGTLGPSMVEGRISQGVVVGAHSDIGGGASLMGTLSGGGKERVYVGERSLVGANAGIGVAIGSYCIVEAGTYVTAGKPIRLPDGRIVKARDLSGQNGLLFRQNGHDGVIEAIPNKKAVELNPILHASAGSAAL